MRQIGVGEQFVLRAEVACMRARDDAYTHSACCKEKITSMNFCNKKRRTNLATTANEIVWAFAEEVLASAQVGS